MKRVFALLLIFLLAGMAWGGGQGEAEIVAESVPEVFTGTLILGVEKGDRMAAYTTGTVDLIETPTEEIMWYRDVVLKDFPGKVEIRAYATDSTNIKMDADIAGGDMPDVYWDYLGRLNKYANAKYAVPIELTAEEQADYFPSFLDLCTKDGVLYALPSSAWAATMVVNKTLIESAGMGDILVDGKWTIDEFIAVTEAVQEMYGPKYYGYAAFAAGTGGDYWSSFGWLGSFGAKLYDNGKIVIDSPEGKAALSWMKEMQDTGIFAPGAAGLDYLKNFEAMKTGDIVACGAQPKRAQPTDLADGSGTIEAVQMEWPTAPGVDLVPISMGPDAVMLFKSGDSAREAAALELARYMARPEIQEAMCRFERRFPSRQVVGNVLPDDVAYTQGAAMIAKHGVFDTGIGLTQYAEVRSLWPPALQSIFMGELTVDEAIDRFVTEGTEILEEN